MDEAALIRVADTMLDQGLPALNVVLHSSELAPGTSIYCRSPADVTTVLARLRRLFEHVMKRCDGWGCTLLELRDSLAGTSRLRELV